MLRSVELQSTEKFFLIDLLKYLAILFSKYNKKLNKKYFKD